MPDVKLYLQMEPLQGTGAWSILIDHGIFYKDGDSCLIGETDFLVDQITSIECNNSIEFCIKPYWKITEPIENTLYDILMAWNWADDRIEICNLDNATFAAKYLFNLNEAEGLLLEYLLKNPDLAEELILPFFNEISL